MQYISLGYKNAFYLWCCHSNIQADEQTRACEHVTGGWGMVGKNFPTAVSNRKRHNQRADLKKKHGSLLCRLVTHLCLLWVGLKKSIPIT